MLFSVVYEWKNGHISMRFGLEKKVDGTREHFKLHWLHDFNELHAVSVDLRVRSILSTLIWYCTHESLLNISNSHGEIENGKYGHTRSFIINNRVF